MNSVDLNMNHDNQGNIVTGKMLALFSNNQENIPGENSFMQQFAQSISKFNLDLERARTQISAVLTGDDTNGRTNIAFEKNNNNCFQPDSKLWNCTGEQLINETEQLLLQTKFNVELVCADLQRLKHRHRPCTGMTTDWKAQECICNKNTESISTNIETVNQDKRSELIAQQDNGNDTCIDFSWKDWPPFVYMNSVKNKFHHSISCVLQSKPNTFNRDDLNVHSSDTDEDLATCLQSNDEQILSCLVTLESKHVSGIHMKTPLYMYLPAVGHKHNFSPIIKYKTNGNGWQQSETLDGIDLPIDRKTMLIGSKLPVEYLKEVQCVAVAVRPCERFIIGVIGGTIKLQNDRNIEFTIPPETFLDETTITTTTKLMPDLHEASSRYSELHFVRETSSLVKVNFNQTTHSPIEFNIHDFGPKGVGVENLSEFQETLQRCRKWLAKNLAMDSFEMELTEILPTDDVKIIMKQPSNLEKVDMLVEKLLNCSKSSFETLIAALEETCQAHIAERLCIVRDQVILWRKRLDLSDEEELEYSSDFDTEFELDKVHFLSKSDDHEWTINQYTSDGLNTYTIQLGVGISSFSVVGVVVPENVSCRDLTEAVRTLDDVSCLTNVTLILRQHRETPDDVIIHCIRSDQAEQQLLKYEKMGYTEGSPNLPSFGIVDGEQLELNFESDISLEGYEKKCFVMTFYSQLDISKYTGRLCISNHDSHVTHDRYNGHLTYRVISAKVAVERCGIIEINLPKPTDEQIGYFSYTLNFAGKALAKYLALKLTLENANSTRWIKNANQLVQDSNIYKSIVNYVNKDLWKANERQRCEMFLLYWADHYVGPEENKLDRMIDIFNQDQKLQNEAHQFIRPYCLSGTLSNDNLKKMAYCLAEDWVVMAKKLGLRKATIDEIKGTQRNMIRQSLKMLDTWRISDAAVSKGTDVVKYLYECAKSAKCSSKLLNTITGHN